MRITQFILACALIGTFTKDTAATERPKIIRNRE